MKRVDVTMKAMLFGVLLLLGSLLNGSDLSSLKALRYGAENLHTAYLDQVGPLRDLRAVSNSYADLIVTSASQVRTSAFGWSGGARNVENALAQMGSTWQAYLATPLNRTRGHWASTQVR